MNKTVYIKEYDGARAEVFVFAPEGATAEAHVMLHATDGAMPFEAQREAIRHAADRVLEGLEGLTTVFGRSFLSDSANQRTVNGIEQPPLDGTKMAQWLYLQGKGSGCYRHLWGSMSTGEGSTSYEQTKTLLADYAAALRAAGCTLERNCVRTWFFVQNVDVNYSGLVRARNEVFAAEGLAPDTHFIASTGIGGRSADPNAFVAMDTYAIDGLQPGQLKYLYARTHLNPTYEYGVAFERGAVVDYADRRHVLISGTASIDNKGQIVYEGDIRRQTLRMWENVEALLQEAGCTWDDVAHIIVYLRDVSDYATVKAMYDERFPHTPRVITYARVCRSGWLIEMECMAIAAASNPQYAAL